MGKGSKKGNRGKNLKQQYVKATKKPQMGDAKKLKDINEFSEVQALSWTLEEEENDAKSNASADMNTSNMDHLSFKAASHKLLTGSLLLELQ